MPRRLLIATALLSALLGGCAMHHHRPDQPRPRNTVEPTAPVVLVADGIVMIDQGVLRFAKDQTKVRISWRLQGRDGKRLTFPANGVVFERAADGEIVDCGRSADNTVFSCTNLHTRPGVYRYGINVDEDGKPLKPLDPFLMND